MGIARKGRGAAVAYGFLLLLAAAIVSDAALPMEEGAELDAVIDGISASCRANEAALGRFVCRYTVEKSLGPAGETRFFLDNYMYTWDELTESQREFVVKNSDKDEIPFYGVKPNNLDERQDCTMARDGDEFMLRAMNTKSVRGSDIASSFHKQTVIRRGMRFISEAERRKVFIDPITSSRLMHELSSSWGLPVDYGLRVGWEGERLDEFLHDARDAGCLTMRDVVVGGEALWEFDVTQVGRDSWTLQVPKRTPCVVRRAQGFSWWPVGPQQVRKKMLLKEMKCNKFIDGKPSGGIFPAEGEVLAYNADTGQERLAFRFAYKLGSISFEKPQAEMFSVDPDEGFLVIDSCHRTSYSAGSPASPAMVIKAADEAADDLMHSALSETATPGSVEGKRQK